jgi:nucleotide-binding universal stress UspA family protein
VRGERSHSVEDTQGVVVACVVLTFGSLARCAPAAALCESEGLIDAPLARGCCGIQGDQWQRLMDADTRDALEQALRLLESIHSRPVNVAVEAGSSVTEALQQAAGRWACDVVAVSRKRRPWSGGLSRRGVKALRRSLDLEVVELGNNAGKLEWSCLAGSSAALRG